MKRSMRDLPKRLFVEGTPECALLCMALGALTAFLLIAVGFWKTMFIVGCIAALAFAAGIRNKKQTIRKVYARLTGRNK